MIRNGQCVLAAVVFLAAAVFAGSAAAQETAAAAGPVMPGAGGNGLVVNVPNSNSSSIAYRYFLSDKGALQLDFGLGWQAEHEVVDETTKNKATMPSGFGVKLGPSYLVYLQQKRVAPYLRFGAALAKNGGKANKTNDDVQVSATAGCGAEFFIIPNFSIGGEALLDIPLAPWLKFGTATPSLYAAFYF